MKIGDRCIVLTYPPEPEMVGSVGVIVSMGTPPRKIRGMVRSRRGENGIALRFVPPVHGCEINTFHTWEIAKEPRP